MAVVKLGALITGIAGSVGGFTFRRNSGTTMLYIRPKGASKNRLLQNPQLGLLRSVIQGWSLLTQALRDDWSVATLLFQFPDKFGVMGNLPARMFYIKLTARLSLVGQPSPDPTVLNSNIPKNSIISGSIISAGIKKVTMANLIPAIDYIITIERTNNSSVSPTFTRRKMLMHTQLGISLDITFTTEFDLLFPNALPNEDYIIYVTPQNADGFKAVPLFLKILST